MPPKPFPPTGAPRPAHRATIGHAEPAFGRVVARPTHAALASARNTLSLSRTVQRSSSDRGIAKRETKKSALPDALDQLVALLQMPVKGSSQQGTAMGIAPDRVLRAGLPLQLAPNRGARRPAAERPLPPSPGRPHAARARPHAAVTRAIQCMQAPAVNLSVGAQVVHTHRNGGINLLIIWALTGAGAATANGYIIQEIQVFDELSLCATGKIVSTTQATYYEAWKVTAGAIEEDGVDAWHLEPTPNGVTRSARVVGKAKFIATNEPDGWERGVSPFALTLRSSFVAPAAWAAHGLLNRSIAIESAACRDDRFYELYFGGQSQNWQTHESNNGFRQAELQLRPNAQIRRAAASEILRLVADYLAAGGGVVPLIRTALGLALAEINFPENAQAVLALGNAVPALLRSIIQEL